MNYIVNHCLPPRKSSQAFMKAMAVWDHSLVFMAAKCSYLDRDVLVEQPCRVVIFATPVNAAALTSKQLLQENGGGTEETCLCSSVCPGSAHVKLLTQHCSSKPQCRCSQFHHIIGYSLSNIVSRAVLLGGWSFSRCRCLWVRLAPLPAGS